MIYDLKHPFIYAKDADTGAEKKAVGIEFRRPKGKESQKVFTILSALKPFAEGGEIPDDLAERVLAFTAAFGTVVGDENQPMDMITGHIDASDIMPIATEILDSFM